MGFDFCYEGFNLLTDFILLMSRGGAAKAVDFFNFQRRLYKSMMILIAAQSILLPSGEKEVFALELLECFFKTSLKDGL